ncbi:MAG: RpiB/LacA/LacB family sugar-phosphate isomerase, partial [Clostridia bacterium]|nr:RpiB/LacA/LacB family sugar-phosphate isomerase [Clostridia bacterium]
MKRTIFIGADSAGFPLKEELKKHLIETGWTVTDLGTDSTASCHYPLFAAAVCREVQKDPDNRFGVQICGTGIGMSMCANKFDGVRAALCSDTYSARLTRN